MTTKQQKRMILELDIYDFSKIDIDRKNKIQKYLQKIVKDFCHFDD